MDLEHAVFLMWGMLGHLEHTSDPTKLLRLDEKEHRAALAEALRTVLHALSEHVDIQDVTAITRE